MYDWVHYRMYEYGAVDSVRRPVAQLKEGNLTTVHANYCVYVLYNICGGFDMVTYQCMIKIVY